MRGSIGSVTHQPANLATHSSRTRVEVLIPPRSTSHWRPTAFACRAASPSVTASSAAAHGPRQGAACPTPRSPGDRRSPLHATVASLWPALAAPPAPSPLRDRLLSRDAWATARAQPTAHKRGRCRGSAGASHQRGDATRAVKPSAAAHGRGPQGSRPRPPPRRHGTQAQSPAISEAARPRGPRGRTERGVAWAC